MKIPVDSGLLAALVSGFTLAVRHDRGTPPEETSVPPITDHLAATAHTLGDVQQKLADLQKSLTADPGPALDAAINELLGMPDHTGAGTSPIVAP